MGNACSTDSSDNKVYDARMKNNVDYDPSNYQSNFVKFPQAKVPRKTDAINQLNSQAGVFAAKNTINIPSGTPSEPRQLNNAGLIYDGEWLNGIPHGKGELYYPDGSYYVGYFTKGSPDGQGRFVSPQGWIYEGQLQNQQAQGKGILYHKQLQYKFQGKWSGDLPNGYGRQQWQKKKIYYEGEFLNGKKHGEGKYITPEYEYKGNFNDNQFDSSGFIAYRNGDKFEGNFEKGKRNGRGTFTWDDGSYYEGSYKHDVKHGQGKYKAKNSVEWEGEWVHGKREGTGILKTTQNSYRGSWSNNIAQNKSQLKSNISMQRRSMANTSFMK